MRCSIGPTPRHSSPRCPWWGTQQVRARQRLRGSAPAQRGQRQVVAQRFASTGVAPCMTVVCVEGSAGPTHCPAQADVLAPASCIHAPSQPAGLEGLSDGVYHPPKLNPVAMPEDRALSNKEMRRVREAQRRAQRRCVAGSRALRVVHCCSKVDCPHPVWSCTRLHLVASGAAGGGPILLHPHTLRHPVLHPFTCSLLCAAVLSCVSWLRSWLVHLRR